MGKRSICFCAKGGIQKRKTPCKFLEKIIYINSLNNRKKR